MDSCRLFSSSSTCSAVIRFTTPLYLLKRFWHPWSVTGFFKTWRSFGRNEFALVCRIQSRSNVFREKKTCRKWAWNSRAKTYIIPRGFGILCWTYRHGFVRKTSILFDWQWHQQIVAAERRTDSEVNDATRRQRFEKPTIDIGYATTNMTKIDSFLPLFSQLRCRWSQHRRSEGISLWQTRTTLIRSARSIQSTLMETFTSA